jgi:hypothetical protein
MIDTGGPCSGSIKLDILEALIQAKANVHLWDAEEFYGPLWDAASSACTSSHHLKIPSQMIDTGGPCSGSIKFGSSPSASNFWQSTSKIFRRD